MAGFGVERRRAGHTPEGVALFGYAPSPGLPAVVVLSSRSDPPPDRAAHPRVHAHYFLQLVYVEAGQCHLHVDCEAVELHTGDAVLIVPGAIMTNQIQRADEDTQLWTVLFRPDAVDPGAPEPLASWRSQSLLAPFARSTRGAHSFAVPVENRQQWVAHLTSLHTELRERRSGFVDAVRAHLVLLLTDLSRLTPDGPLDLVDWDPTLSAVFEFIEVRYREQISLKDVAAAVAQSSGHLATLMKDRTGRTVGEWITERRMREARRLLLDADLTIGDIAAQLGYGDPGYFTRRFHAEHQVSPTAWRHADR
ncbi:AraC family transcriptional regulator [Mycolicibacterium hodleri]|uniref:AraC family transcriptional regulator n=1 Tax=Mycolicibacterium hodleri TaxID=49897 RepID=UPI0013754CF8|nr:AraC family transcriptional regulator [Mycolicibacterium hodleri]